MIRQLSDYLPPVIREFVESQAIIAGQQPIISDLWDAVDAAFNDQFVLDATENGVTRWERILRIVPKGTDTLEVRRFRILTRLNEQLPFTMGTLREQLETLCGENNFSVTMTTGTYILIVRIMLVAKQNYDDVDAMLRRITPANIKVDLDLLYNTHDVLSQYTHSHLSAYTHNELRSEVLR